MGLGFALALPRLAPAPPSPSSPLPPSLSPSPSPSPPSLQRPLARLFPCREHLNRIRDQGIGIRGIHSALDWFQCRSSCLRSDARQRPI